MSVLGKEHMTNITSNMKMKMKMNSKMNGPAIDPRKPDDVSNYHTYHITQDKRHFNPNTTPAAAGALYAQQHNKFQPPLLSQYPAAIQNKPSVRRPHSAGVGGLNGIMVQLNPMPATKKEATYPSAGADASGADGSLASPSFISTAAAPISSTPRTLLALSGSVSKSGKKSDRLILERHHHIQKNDTNATTTIGGNTDTNTNTSASLSPDLSSTQLAPAAPTRTPSIQSPPSLSRTFSSARPATPTVSRSMSASESSLVPPPVRPPRPSSPVPTHALSSTQQILRDKPLVTSYASHKPGAAAPQIASLMTAEQQREIQCTFLRHDVPVDTTDTGHFAPAAHPRHHAAPIVGAPVAAVAVSVSAALAALNELLVPAPLGPKWIHPHVHFDRVRKQHPDQQASAALVEREPQLQSSPPALTRIHCTPLLPSAYRSMPVSSPPKQHHTTVSVSAAIANSGLVGTFRRSSPPSRPISAHSPRQPASAAIVSFSGTATSSSSSCSAASAVLSAFTPSTPATGWLQTVPSSSFRSPGSAAALSATLSSYPDSTTAAVTATGPLVIGQAPSLSPRGSPFVHVIPAPFLPSPPPVPPRDMTVLKPPPVLADNVLQLASNVSHSSTNECSSGNQRLVNTWTGQGDCLSSAQSARAQRDALVCGESQAHRTSITARSSSSCAPAVSSSHSLPPQAPAAASEASHIIVATMDREGPSGGCATTASGGSDNDATAITITAADGVGPTVGSAATDPSPSFSSSASSSAASLSAPALSMIPTKPSPSPSTISPTHHVDALTAVTKVLNRTDGAGVTVGRSDGDNAGGSGDPTNTSAQRNNGLNDSQGSRSGRRIGSTVRLSRNSTKAKVWQQYENAFKIEIRKKLSTGTLLTAGSPGASVNQAQLHEDTERVHPLQQHRQLLQSSTTKLITSDGESNSSRGGSDGAGTVVAGDGVKSRQKRASSKPKSQKFHFNIPDNNHDNHSRSSSSKPAPSVSSTAVSVQLIPATDSASRTAFYLHSPSSTDLTLSLPMSVSSSSSALSHSERLPEQPTAPAPPDLAVVAATNSALTTTMTDTIIDNRKSNGEHQNLPVGSSLRRRTSAEHNKNQRTNVTFSDDAVVTAGTRQEDNQSSNGEFSPATTKPRDVNQQLQQPALHQQSDSNDTPDDDDGFVFEDTSAVPAEMDHFLAASSSLSSERPVEVAKNSRGSNTISNGDGSAGYSNEKMRGDVRLVRPSGEQPSRDIDSSNNQSRNPSGEDRTTTSDDAAAAAAVAAGTGHTAALHAVASAAVDAFRTSQQQSLHALKESQSASSVEHSDEMEDLWRLHHLQQHQQLQLWQLRQQQAVTVRREDNQDRMMVTMPVIPVTETSGEMERHLLAVNLQVAGVHVDRALPPRSPLQPAVLQPVLLRPPETSVRQMFAHDKLHHQSQPRHGRRPHSAPSSGRPLFPFEMAAAAFVPHPGVLRTEMRALARAAARNSHHEIERDHHNHHQPHLGRARSTSELDDFYASVPAERLFARAPPHGHDDETPLFHPYHLVDGIVDPNEASSGQSLGSLLLPPNRPTSAPPSMSAEMAAADSTHADRASFPTSREDDDTNDSTARSNGAAVSTTSNLHRWGHGAVSLSSGTGRAVLRPAFVPLMHSMSPPSHRSASASSLSSRAEGHSSPPSSATNTSTRPFHQIQHSDREDWHAGIVDGNESSDDVQHQPQAHHYYDTYEELHTTGHQRTQPHQPPHDHDSGVCSPVHPTELTAAIQASLPLTAMKWRLPHSPNRMTPTSFHYAMKLQLQQHERKRQPQLVQQLQAHSVPQTARRHCTPSQLHLHGDDTRRPHSALPLSASYHQNIVNVDASSTEHPPSVDPGDSTTVRSSYELFAAFDAVAAEQPQQPPQLLLNDQNGGESPFGSPDSSQFRRALGMPVHSKPSSTNSHGLTRPSSAPPVNSTATAFAVPNHPQIVSTLIRPSAGIGSQFPNDSDSATMLTAATMSAGKMSYSWSSSSRPSSTSFFRSPPSASRARHISAQQEYRERQRLRAEEHFLGVAAAASERGPRSAVAGFDPNTTEYVASAPFVPAALRPHFYAAQHPNNVAAQNEVQPRYRQPTTSSHNRTRNGSHDVHAIPILTTPPDPALRYWGGATARYHAAATVPKAVQMAHVAPTVQQSATGSSRDDRLCQPEQLRHSSLQKQSPLKLSSASSRSKITASGGFLVRDPSRGRLRRSMSSSLLAVSQARPTSAAVRASVVPASSPAVALSVSGSHVVSTQSPLSVRTLTAHASIP